MDNRSVGIELLCSVTGIVSKALDHVFVALAKLVLRTNLQSQFSGTEVFDQVFQYAIREQFLVCPTSLCAKYACQLFNILLFNSTEGIVDCSTNISSFRAYIDPMRAFRNLEGMVLRKCSKLLVTTGNIQCFLCLFVIHIRNALEEQKRYNIFLIVLGRNYTIENICAFSQIRFQVSLCHFTH